MSRLRLARIFAPIAVALTVAVVGRAHAGHELPFYPSFSPQEIKIETVDPGTAASRLQQSTLHVYVGADPFVGGTVPNDVTPVESLGAFIVVTIDPAIVPDRTARCAVADTLLDRLAAAKADYVFHPYPITPYHADYLGHFDRVEAARKAVERRRNPHDLRMRMDATVRGRGPIAEKLAAAVGASGPSTDPAATIEQIDLETLLSDHRVQLNGWLGPPWLKQGWYQAYLLASNAISDPDGRRALARTYERLVAGRQDDTASRINLERELVSTLTRGCERVVAGYTVKREYTSSEYSLGVENVAWDSQLGLNSPIFVRTVKLKDFPWNGWLRVGTPSAPTAAWNPIGGFTDTTGRLIWATLGDPAFIALPHGGSWLPNRTDASVAATVRGGVAVPADAVRPAAGTGALAPVGPGKRARTKLVYRVRASAFHDGTRMTVADVLYAVGLPYRWSAATPPVTDADAGIAAASALFRARLVALRVVKVETVVKKYSDVEFVYQVPIVETYVDHAADDPAETAALAPPWSAVPWHVTALMEEAARRGLGALSRDEAARRGVPWLDIVRDAKTRDALAGLVETFRAQGFVPAPLRKDVSVADARARWTALKAFYGQHGHFLVTNGPYRLDQWSADAIVLGVFRDLTYPIGVGTFDEYAVPLRAFVTKVDDRGDRLELRADVERVSKFARSYEVIREALGPEKPGLHEHAPSGRYVVVNADGQVVRAGRAPHDAQRVFRVELRGLERGAYTVMIALEAGGNTVKTPITVVPHTVGAQKP